MCAAARAADGRGPRDVHGHVVAADGAEEAGRGARGRGVHALPFRARRGALRAPLRV